MTCQDTDDFFSERHKKNKACWSLFSSLSHTRESVCVCQMRAVRCCVYIFRPLTRESLLPVSAILEQNYHCALYSCHSVDDHQVVDEDDAEGGHHTQPVLGSTVHEAGFPDCKNCCPRLLSNLEVRTNCGVNLVSSLFSFPFYFTNSSYCITDSLVLTSWFHKSLAV